MFDLYQFETKRRQFPNTSENMIISRYFAHTITGAAANTARGNCNTPLEFGKVLIIFLAIVVLLNLG